MKPAEQKAAEANDRPTPDASGDGPRWLGLVVSINDRLAALNPAVVIGLMVLVAVALSEIVALGIWYLVYGHIPAEVPIIILFAALLVSLPLNLLAIKFLVGLDRSRRRLREMRDRAVAETEAKTRFLAGMSHELRTPLNAILGFSEMITDQTYGPIGHAKYLDYAADIHYSGTHLLGIVNELLQLSKIESGMLELQEGDVALAACIAESVRLVQDRARGACISLDTDLSEESATLYADGRLVRQMLLNLLSNALKFTPAGGRVMLRACRERGRGLTIAVSDTGVGIPPDDIDKAMEPFGQLENAVTREGTGTGLGLPLVKSMIELHGGRFRLESAPGAGTTVTLYFPPERVRLGRA